jgi:hypothetical protein
MSYKGNYAYPDEKHLADPLCARPWRLWDPKTKKHLVGKNYGMEYKAHDGALIAIRWGKVDDTIEVYDARTGKLGGQYTRKVSSVMFTKGA